MHRTDSPRTPPFVVFTDLDGSLLDARSYSWEAARPALAALRKLQIPIVLTSSKTRGEIELLRRELDLHDPFIAENGGALYCPPGYFATIPPETHRQDGWDVLELGTPYTLLRQALREIATEVGVALRGFRDMPPPEVATLTRLSPANAALAMARDYDEPFVLDASPQTVLAIEQAARRRGLAVTCGGRFYHLQGGSDKGHACQRLLECYQRQQPQATERPCSVALGDSANDLSMLRVVNYPIVIPRPDGSYEPALCLPTATYAPAAGPQGWNLAILALLETREGNPGADTLHRQHDPPPQAPPA